MDKINEEGLIARDITFRYYEKSKKNILNDVNITVNRSEIAIMVGASGSGKSTLAKIIAGLLSEKEENTFTGDIKVDGENIKYISPAKRASYITMMFQNCDLQFCMETLREELIFCLENLSIAPEEMEKRILKVVRLVGIEDLLERRLSTLSGGQKQKAAICCNLVLESKYMILDEPFANIDSKSAEELVLLLGKLNKEIGLTLLVIDHQIERWLNIATRIILLGQNGKIIKSSINPSRLKDNIEDFYKEGLLFAREKTENKPKQIKKDSFITISNLNLSYEPNKFKFLEKYRKRSIIEDKKLVLKEANANFKKGNITVLVGPSGCGKTTLLHSILGYKNYEGKIILNKEEIRKIPAKKMIKEIGIVFQNPSNQFITQLVWDEVMYSINQRKEGLSENEEEKIVEKLLRGYGLLNYKKYSPYMLSQGQQRRLAVLAVTAGIQKLLLLDEPTYGQDYTSTCSIMNQIKDRVKSEGLTVILSTHDEVLANEFGDEVYEIIKGKLLLRRSE